jgi:hypothetical protein
MGNGRHIRDARDLEADGIERAHGRFPTRTGALDPDFEILDPAFLRGLAGGLGCNCAAKGVDFREPLKPAPPEVAQDRALPCRSVIVTMVLLKDA